MAVASAPAAHTSGKDKLLFWACFIALVATAFGFIVRALIIDEWGSEFGLTQTQKGEIFGVGLWPFAISIILFSLVVDKIGYKIAMAFAFFCHVLSAAITIWAPKHYDPYWSLYIGTFIVALGNGTVEAVINPVVATLFAREKTKWLNILHAGWPGGLVIGGIIAILMGGAPWEYKVGLILIPTVLYGLMMLACRFPVSERVAAGVSYREMLKEFGALGAYVVSSLIILEVSRVMAERGWIYEGWTDQQKFWTGMAVALIPAVAFGAYVHSLGRPLFVFMLLIMIPLATTELGTDSWITDLMKPAMADVGIAAGWVLVYTSLIMMVLRFFAGPIVHKLSPLGLLAGSAAVAAIGLVLLSRVEQAIMILAAATVYGFGKTFFWPTMLGVVAEQSPKGGALTLNATGGVGMLGVGVIGAVLLGYIQDTSIESHLKEEAPSLHSQVVDRKTWVFGTLEAVDPSKVTSETPLASPPGDIESLVKQNLRKELKREPTAAELKEALESHEKYQFAVQLDAIRKAEREALQKSLGREPTGPELEAALKDDADYQRLTSTEGYAEQAKTRTSLAGIENRAKQTALSTVAIFPCIMLVCYLVLIVYFRAKGGYQAQVLTGHAAHDEEFTGGVAGPADK